MNRENTRKLQGVEPLWSTYIHAKASRLGIPLSGNFELTARCNFNCKMCYVHQQHCPAEKELSADQWIAIGKTARDQGMLFLLLTGGDDIDPALYGETLLNDTIELTPERDKMEAQLCAMAKEGKITEGHCKALAGIEDPDRQYAAALRMVDRGESVRQAESKNRLTKKEQKIDPKYRYLYEDIEDRFQGFFGTKVKLDQGKRKGRIKH